MKSSWALLAVGSVLAAAAVWLLWRPPVGAARDELPRHGAAPPQAASGPTLESDRRTPPAGDLGPASDPAAPLVDPEFDGRNAALSGRVHRAEHGVAAELACVAGMNVGTVLSTDATGRFAATTLFPGLTRLEVRVAGRVEAERDVVLRAMIPVDLDLDLADRRVVRGVVVDAGDRPLAGARVTCDGRATTSGADGVFVLADVLGGRALLRAELAGYAANEVTAWHQATGTLRLARGGTLVVTVPPTDGDHVHVYVLPDLDARTAYPWSRRNPTLARPGSRLTLTDLPADTCSIVALAAGATSAPVAARLQADTTTEVALAWQPMPRLVGTVRAAGRSLAGAEITLHVADEFAATMRAIGDARAHGRSVPFAPMPALRQTVRSDTQGTFELGLPDVRSGLVELVVEAAGYAPVRHPVRPGERRLAVDLDR